MNILRPNQKILIVVDKDYYPLILNYKNRNPNLNIKVINRNGLIDKAGYRFSKDPLPHLIKEKGIEIDYSKAKKYLNIIRCLKGRDETPLDYLIEDLEDYVTVDDYGLEELSRYQIYLLEMDEDEEIKSLLSNQNISFNLLHLSDLNLTKYDSLQNSNIVHFSNKFSQFSHIFSDIRQKTKDDPNVKEKIKILVKSESDLFYIYTLGKLFGVDIYSIDEVPFLANPNIAKSIKKIFENKSFELEEDGEDFELLKSLIKQYGLDEIDDFDYAYSNLLEILSSQKEYIQHGDKGVVVMTTFTFNPDDIIYVTNFEYGCFYKEYSDNNVLSDSELRDLHLTTSYNKTALDERKKRNFLMYNNVVLLSRVKQHQSDSIYNSHFVDDDIKKRIITRDKIDEINVDGEFTDEMVNLLNAHQYDQHYFYKTIDGYRDYDHSYKGIKANQLMEKDKWSVTNLEKYYDCPFKYLMDTLIPLPSDLHHAYRGTFIHSIFENMMHDVFDFDSSFEKAKKEYIEKMKKNNEEFSNKEEMWLEMYRYWLINMIPSVRSIKDHMNYVLLGRDYELPISFEIEGYKFTGYIDKIVCTENGTDRYYTIVDYKTGKETYDDMSLAVGKSIQLPLYYYALRDFPKNSKYVEDCIFGGFLIQHIYFKSIKDAYVDDTVFSESNFLKKSRYSGVSFDNERYASSFDDTVYTAKGEYDITKGKYLNGKLTFNKPDDDSTLLSKPPLGLERFNLNDTVELAKRAAVRIIKKIINNEFEIAPSGKDISSKLKLDSLKCSFCGHRDICYVKPVLDAKDYTGFIRDEIMRKEDDSNE